MVSKIYLHVLVVYRSSAHSWIGSKNMVSNTVSACLGCVPELCSQTVPAHLGCVAQFYSQSATALNIGSPGISCEVYQHKILYKVLNSLTLMTQVGRYLNLIIKIVKCKMKT